MFRDNAQTNVKYAKTTNSCCNATCIRLICVSGWFNGCIQAVKFDEDVRFTALQHGVALIQTYKFVLDFLHIR